LITFFFSPPIEDPILLFSSCITPPPIYRLFSSALFPAFRTLSISFRPSCESLGGPVSPSSLFLFFCASPSFPVIIFLVTPQVPWCATLLILFFLFSPPPGRDVDVSLGSLLYFFRPPLCPDLLCGPLVLPKVRYLLRHFLVFFLRFNGDARSPLTCIGFSPPKRDFSRCF